MSYKPATILASQTRLMKSKITKRQYRISIALPYAYYESPGASWPFDKPLKQWPVIYLTDANYYFGLVTDMVRAMAWCGRSTDAIIVGIGYREQSVPQKAWQDSVAWRDYDFTPVRVEKEEENSSEWLQRRVVTGGAPNFLQFIKQELIPAIEGEFNTDPKRRILVGHSLGGLFAAFALLAEPGLFESYIIGSPSLSYGERCVFKQEEQFAQEQKQLDARVHLWVGEREETATDAMVSDTVRFGAILESRSYKGLMLVKQIFADENHCEVIAPGFQAGLKWALERRNEEK